MILLSEQIDINLNVNMNNAEDVDELTSRLDTANEKAEELTNTLADIYMGEIDGDAEAIEEELSNVTNEAENLQSQLENVDNTNVSPDVDSTGLDELSSKAEEASTKLDETSSTGANLTTALAGIGGVVGVEQMVSTADRINTSWNQLKLTFNGTGVSLTDLKNKTSQVATSTGQAGSTVRGYFNQMGIAGIKNTALLSTSFQSLSGRSYQTGQSIESMESKVQKMVMTGNAGSRMLTGLGISAKNLGEAMGVTEEEASDAFAALNQEERLQALTKAMGDGTTANEMYKNSYVGLKQQAETSIAGLMGAVGQGILPVINPLIQQATNLVRGFTGAFQSLPGPVQSVVGSIGGFVAVGTAAVGAIGLLGQVGSGLVDGLRNMKKGYDTVRGAMSTVRAVMTALTSAESISEGVRAALAAATGAESVAEGANAAAKTAATGPTMGLAIAENALLWPLLLIVGAVVAVTAAMWYLYNSNETVRNSVNWLINRIQAFIGALQPIISAIANFVTKGIANLNKFPSLAWTVFLAVIGVVGKWAVSFISKGVAAASNFISSVRAGLSGIGAAVSTALSNVYNAITSPFQKAWDYVNNNVIKPLTNAWDTVSSAFGSYSGYSSFTGYSGVDDTLNNSIASISNTQSNRATTINNNFNGLIEESAADYIVNAVNDRLRREKLLKGA